MKVVVDKHRVDGSRVRLAEVEIGDETGIVSLRARDDQIDIVQAVAAKEGAVVLRNCTLELYQGKHIRLAVTKWGKLSMYPDSVPSTPPPPSKMNRDRNFSLIDLSLVASEMATFHTPAPATNDIVQQQQQSLSYHHQSSHSSENESYQKQSVQQQHVRLKGRKGSRGKQVNINNTNKNPPPLQYQAVDPITSSAGTMRYNVHSLPPPQGGLHPTAYGSATGYANHQQHPMTASTAMHRAIPPQHFQYQAPNRQRTENLAMTHQQQQHHHQQMMFQHQFEMQQRHMHHLYQAENSSRIQQQPIQSRQTGYERSSSHGGSRQGTSGGQGFNAQQPHKQRQQAHINQHQVHRPPATASPQQQPIPTSDDAPGSPGKMNPKAASFDPTTSK